MVSDVRRAVKATARIGLDKRGKDLLKAAKIEVFYKRKTMRFHTGVHLTIEE